MSIFSQAIEGKITFAQAVTEIESWGAKELGLAPTAVQQDVAAAQDDLKQALATGLGLADTAIGGAITIATPIAESAVTGLIMSATGGVAAPLTPAVDASITAAANALKAGIDAELSAWRKSLTQPAATGTGGTTA